MPRVPGLYVKTVEKKNYRLNIFPKDLKHHSALNGTPIIFISPIYKSVTVPLY